MSGFVVRKLGIGGAIASAVFFTGLAGVAPAQLTAPAAAQMFSQGYEFLEAVKERDGDAVTEMLNQPGTQVVNTRDITNGQTGLHIVAQRRDALWIRFLIQRGADPNIRDKTGTYPIQISAALGDIDSVEALIKGGAQVDVADQQGETPLISAVHKRDIALIARLLKEGANPDRSDNSGRSARDYAELLIGNERIMEEFASADAERGKKGTTEQYGPSF
ncbi:MAG: ankyrin repeat domain-containing protein [Erythrobacter sp.]|uniref:ankyrin repeat domain-containing protein n=1 Tax=Erythrobacter sp. TaxID=1042 RepID=UPI00262FFA03|nr:ankyrin repeat domain-containing protein [Erythrobacter sp.]MDJ0978992.1 ankyrin repeat domain-containing protein [Erythrobacter sp.]